MSCCWDCQYKQNCIILYTKGEQYYCDYFQTKYETFETFLRAEAKSRDFYYTKEINNANNAKM